MSNKFHDHLDTCKQCRENPFGLCIVGEELLKAEVTVKVFLKEENDTKRTI